jgi:hypothetical protein
MSRTRFLLTFAPLVSLGLFGVWLGFQTREPSDPRLLVSPLLVLGVLVGLLITFRRDLREPEAEKRAEWERTKAKGKPRHVVSLVGFGMLSWVLLLLLPSLLVDVYWGGESWGVTLQHLRRHAALGVLVAAICGLWAMAWWSSQERKYRGVI